MAPKDRSPAPLICHPATGSEATTAVRAACRRTGEAHLAFRFEIEGDLEGLLLPLAGAASRRDRLWEHTCCEAFVANGTGAYVEFNFSPGGDWAVYRFTGYRERQQPDPVVPRPVITARRKPGMFILEATASTSALDGLDAGPGVCIGLAVVAEEASGRRSYWALRHEKKSEPDFHQPGSFLGTLTNDIGILPG